MTSSYEMERFIEDLDDIRKRYLEMLTRCEIMTAALEAPDQWAVPTIEGAEGLFQYIPYDLGGLIEIIQELATVLPDDPDFKHSQQPIRPLSLVEIGCGIGRNLNIFRNQQALPIVKAVGFDIVPEYIEVAQRIYGLGEDVFVNDAMDFDYRGFDLIFYRPFSDDKMQRDFEEYLIDGVKPGAIIIGLNTERLQSSRKVRELDPSGNCYKKL
ncbi:hypothetical protein AB2B41_09805 [Marimonas sp. MJW-29]|uniref:Methyltransferase domain-containing protein n=1 Tax=Sulfitobacter sediminis TaxID=3234186 RepID=A0ABV3RNF9_9RHOB